jgi:nitrile hydratase subunit alpha
MSAMSSPKPEEEPIMEEHFKFPADREARNTARTKAIESLLIEKGVITGETVDKVLEVFETK